MARVLIVGGGCRGLRLASKLVADGDVVRITTRTDSGRAAIESAGAECFIGTPDRLVTLRAAFDGVAIVCWLLATASGAHEQVRVLHGSRLQFFLSQAIDTTVRGLLYEAPRARADVAFGDDAASGDAVCGGAACGGAPPRDGRPGDVTSDMFAEGEQIVRRLTAHNAIPAAFVRANPRDLDAWLTEARGAVRALLGGPLDEARTSPLTLQEHPSRGRFGASDFAMLKDNPSKADQDFR